VKPNDVFHLWGCRGKVCLFTFSRKKKARVFGLSPMMHTTHSDFDVHSAYCAGFLDADGSIIVRIIARPDYKNLYQISPTVSFFQKTCRKHILLDISRDLGSGRVRDRNDGISELNFSGWKEVQKLIERLHPYLRVKKKQANLLRRILEILPSTKESPKVFLEACLLVDHICDLNDSKNRKLTSQIVRERFLSLKMIDV
jgi:hypothetical protein